MFRKKKKRVGDAGKAQKGYYTLAGLGRDRGFLYRDREKLCRDKALWFRVETVGFVSRQDLILARCSWVAAVVAPCRDNVATEVPLSRPSTITTRGQSCDRFGLGWGFLGRDRIFLVATENRQD